MYVIGPIAKPRAERWNYTGATAKRVEPQPRRLETADERKVPRAVLWDGVRALNMLVLASYGRHDAEKYLLAQEEGQRVLVLLGIVRRVY